jgi:hypothetical protein
MPQAWQELLESRRTQELARTQRADGSWGRFHSRDSRANQPIPTTEIGLARALALGLDDRHPVVHQAAAYVAALLQAPIVAFPDPPEKNDRWPTSVRLFTAATLALVWPAHPALTEPRRLWLDIAQRTFASGRYDPAAESCAHRDLTGATVRHSHLVLNGKYQLSLLSSRPEALPRPLETALLDWLWHKEEGLGYLGVKLSGPPDRHKPGQLDGWFSSLELISRFPGWREPAREAIEWLWQNRTPTGLWDFGPRSSGSTALPLSETWRSQTARPHDWTTRTLALLSRFYNNEEHYPQLSNLPTFKHSNL